MPYLLETCIYMDLNDSQSLQQFFYGSSITH